MIEGEGSRPNRTRSEMGEDALSGARVLVAEDSFFIALAIETALHAEGAYVIGPAATLAAATALADAETPDFAIIDLSLDGELSLPLVKALLDRNVRVIAATGYDIEPRLRENLAGVSVIRKPYTTEELLDALRQAQRSQGR